MTDQNLLIECDPVFNASIQAPTVDLVTGLLVAVHTGDGVIDVKDGHRLTPSEPVTAGTWRMMVVQTPGLHVSVWQWTYGTDIFLNGWPVLKIFAGLVLLGVWAIATF